MREDQYKAARDIYLGEWILRDIEGGKQWQQVVEQQYALDGTIRFTLNVVGYFEVYESTPLIVQENTLLEWWKA